MIQKNKRRSYASDLSDSQWAIIEPLFPRAGNRSKWEKHKLVNVVLYFVDNGCKWHIIVNTMGNLLAVAVHVANIHDMKPDILAARDAFEKYLFIQCFYAGAGYRKTFEQDVSWELGLGVAISVCIKPEWEVLPKRWIVERSLAWLNNSRRLSKDYEISVRSAQAVCTTAAFRTLLKRFLPIGTASQSIG